MNQALRIAREESKREYARAVSNTLLTLASNPVLEIVIGYLAIEYLQTHGKMVYNKWGDLDLKASIPYIPQTAGSVAEAGLLVAVALQQPGGLDLLKTAIAAGGESFKTVTKLIPGALTALK